jgi:uncharacterized membrane protein
MVPAGRGVNWWGDAWRLFAPNWMMFIAIVVVFVVLMLVIGLVPIVGSIANTLLSPVFVAGMVAGCRAADRGGQLTLGHLFAGFAERLGPLVVVGLLYVAGWFVIFFIFVVLLAGLAGAGGLAAMLTGDIVQLSVATLAALGIGAVFAALLATLLGIPLLMACWFAPALVMLRNDEPFAAMKTSFAACLANVLPFLVYGLLGIVFAFVASIPFGLGWLVLGPVGVASVYTSYKDIFGD